MAKDVLFPGEGEDEKVVIFKRRHLYLLYQWLQVPVAVLLLSASIAWKLGQALPLAVFILLWVTALMAALWIAWRTVDWGNDRYIVTDRRVIHIEKVLFIREKRDEAPLEMIQDVSIEMEGLMPNLLCFGDMIIQTAGTLGTIRFIGIGKPRKVWAKILTLLSQAKAQMPTEEEWQAIQAVRKLVGLPLLESERLTRKQMRQIDFLNWLARYHKAVTQGTEELSQDVLSGGLSKEYIERHLTAYKDELQKTVDTLINEAEGALKEEVEQEFKLIKEYLPRDIDFWYLRNIQQQLKMLDNRLSKLEGVRKDQEYTRFAKWQVWIGVIAIPLSLLIGLAVAYLAFRLGWIK